MKLTNEHAAEIFSQLGHAIRLCIIRILVETGEQGLKVGEIQKELNIPGSTLSHHLLHLKNAGLIHQYRVSNTLVCSVQYAKLDEAIHYLQSECCVRENTKKAG